MRDLIEIIAAFLIIFILVGGITIGNKRYRLACSSERGVELTIKEHK